LGDELRIRLSWSILKGKLLIRVSGKGLLAGGCAGLVQEPPGVLPGLRLSDEGAHGASPPRQSLVFYILKLLGNFAVGKLTAYTRHVQEELEGTFACRKKKKSKNQSSN